MTVIELNPNHLWFDINSEIESEVRREASNYPNNNNRAYLNLLVEKIILPYLQEDYSDANLLENQAEFWQLGINGTIVSIDDKKLALIPSESSDFDELRVDREWIDIPKLAADYFLSVQVDAEENMMRVWGYTTHKELKEKGTYTKRDCSYSLAREDITEDINSLWLTKRHFPSLATQAEIATIRKLETSNSIELINRLANPQIIFPRRMVDFERWSQIVSQKSRRTELIGHRYFHTKISKVINEQLTSKQLNQTIFEFERIVNNVEQANWQSEGIKVLQELVKNRDITVSGSNEEFQLEELTEELIGQIQLTSINSAPRSERKIRRWSIRSFLGKTVFQAVDRVDSMNSKLDELIEPIGWLLVQEQLSVVREIDNQETREADNTFSKLPLTIAGEEYELNIKPENFSSNIWKFELCKSDRDSLIPAGLKLRLIDEHGKGFENNEEVAIEGQKALVLDKLEFETGEGVIWEIEPTPDNYQREIIRF